MKAHADERAALWPSCFADPPPAAPIRAPVVPTSMAGQPLSWEQPFTINSLAEPFVTERFVVSCSALP